MIELNHKDEYATVDMRPPEGKFTLLDVPTLNELIDVFTEISESSAKVVKVTGHGGCFAVGADLKNLYKYSGYDAKGFSILGNKLFNIMRSAPQVIVGLIDGFCMGGGMDYAAACDFRIATKKSKFAHPGSKLGIITGFGGTQALGRLMKPSYMWELLATGDLYESDFIHESGYVSRIFNDMDEMSEYYNGFAEKVADKKRPILKCCKDFICRA